MHPVLLPLPFIGELKSYGLMLMIGFLTGVWLTVRRASLVKADPDLILNCGFFALIGGVVGSRIMFAAHYWETSFANQPNPFLAVLDITGGGLEFYGGAIGGTVMIFLYLLAKRVSARMYLDIIAPTLMYGLMFGRIGCFLNGCCYGGLCIDEHRHKAMAWAVSFPFGSPAHYRQWENRQLTLPAELVYVPARLTSSAMPVHRDYIGQSVKRHTDLTTRVDEARRAYSEGLVAKLSDKQITKLRRQLEKAEAANKELKHFDQNLRFASRKDPTQPMSFGELKELSSRYRALPVHPVQLYGVINAMLLTLLLLAIFHRRKRHGVVMATMMILYPITRIILELIRVDNPLDSFGLTISQAISVGAFLLGVIFLIWLYRQPLRSPRCVPYVMPINDEPKRKKKSK